MSASSLKVAPICRCCVKVLTLEEMHYLDHGDGSASCEECEQAWMNAMDVWRNGAGDKMPKPP